FGAADGGGGLSSAHMNGSGAAARDEVASNNGGPTGDPVAVNQDADLDFAESSAEANNAVSAADSDGTEGGNSAGLTNRNGSSVDDNGNENKRKDDGAEVADEDDDDDSEIEFAVRGEPQAFDASLTEHSNPSPDHKPTTVSPFSQPSLITTSTTPTRQAAQTTPSDNMTPVVSKYAMQTMPVATKSPTAATNGSTPAMGEATAAAAIATAASTDGADAPMSPDDTRMVDDSEEDMMATDTPVKTHVGQGQAAAEPNAHQAASDLMSFEPAATDTQRRPELTSAKILSDPDLMHAASVPLPVTPAMNGGELTPKQKSSAPGPSEGSDFFIPTDWLMSPDPDKKKKQADSAAASTPPRNGASVGGNLVSMTPVNQKLLDSLEIQWVSPRRVPKFSELDMEEERRGFEEKLAQRDELHRMIMESVKEEFAAKMREVERRAEQEIRKAFEAHKQQMERLAREHAETLKAERRRHAEDISRRDEDTRIQVAELSREIEQGIAERTSIVGQRDKYQVDLEQLATLSAQMEQEKDSHIHGLEQELGNMAVERQRLTQQLNEAMSTAEELSNELEGAMKRVDDLTSENVRLDQENSTLHSDIGVAEHRNIAIKEHAEKMLATANGEIAVIHEQLNAARHEIQSLKTQVSRAESRS
ncbi:hypothetical protein LPJ75_004426, partial [Coemansia sp. RSA 2598]